MSIAQQDEAFHLQLGVNLKEARLAAGKSQADAGGATDLTDGQISRYEGGKNPIAPATLFRLCRLYGRTVASMFDGLRLK